MESFGSDSQFDASTPPSPYSSNVDVVMACFNTLYIFPKQGRGFTQIILEAFTSWTPAALAGQSHVQIRNVEKTLRLVLIHYHRMGMPEHALRIRGALEAQGARMEAAADVEDERRAAEAKRKRDNLDEEISLADKRQRVRGAQQDPATIDIYSTSAAVAGPSSVPDQSAPPSLSGIEGAQAFVKAATTVAGPNALAAFDVKSLPLLLVVELILANLQAAPDDELQRTIESTRQQLNQDTSAGTVPSAPASAPTARPPPPQETDPRDTEAAQVPKNPLKEDIEDEDLRKLAKTGDGSSAHPHEGALADTEAEDIHDALAGLEDFQLAPPEPFSQTEARALIKESVARMCDMGAQAAAFSAELGDSVPSHTLWATLATRLASRGFAGSDTESAEKDGEASSSQQIVKASRTSLEGQADVIRHMLLEFLKVDFAKRAHFAVQWLTEEWYCDLQRKKSGKELRYSHWLRQVVANALLSIDSKDKSLFSFLAELPSVPDEVIEQIGSLCLDKSTMAVGFTSLKELALARPPSRAKSVEILLDLTRSEEKGLRAPAIISVRGWVGQGGPLEKIVLDSAVASLQRLTVHGDMTSAVAQDTQPSANGDEPGSQDEARNPVKDHSFQLSDESQVLQFVELPFALSVKVPDMLDNVFSIYPSMPSEVQKAVRQHIAALVRSLGPNNPKLLQLLRSFPPGSDTLALSVFTIMAEKGRTQALVSAVKEVINEREVDPHFLIPMLPTLTKAEILKHLPRAVTILNSKTAEDREQLKSLFASIVTKPAQGFGSVSTNLPRVRDSEMLTPVELMGLLHSAEKEIGLKTTVDAIRICFSMADIFRSEVLAAALNQLIEEQDLPVLFMRTTIMAVSSYKSLAGYVSSNLLSRLIVKKIWQNKLLWDGFILCVEQTAPGSFAALLQLPQEQLVDVIQRKPALKDGLRAHLEKKVGNNKTKLAAYMELLDGAGGPGGSATPVSTPGTPQHVSASS
jgi:symplekin